VTIIGRLPGTASGRGREAHGAPEGRATVGDAVVAIGREHDERSVVGQGLGGEAGIDEAGTEERESEENARSVTVLNEVLGGVA